MRKLLVITWLILLCYRSRGVILAYNEWVYHLPTPCSPKLQASLPWPGYCINDALKHVDGKPVFLHFFNPDCPCSRFNMSNFEAIVKQYGWQVDFVIVVMNNKRDIQLKRYRINLRFKYSCFV